MRMQKVQFRIGELAKHLEVEKFVIRFWEKEFKLATTRSDGGQRFYSQEDLEQFKLIKTLLYEQGFTIAGAKKYMSSDLAPDTMVGSCKTTLQGDEQPQGTLLEKLVELKRQLVELKKVL